MVSTNYFDILGARPQIGRLFASADGNQPGATPFAVLSHQFWKRRFNGDPAVVGRTLQVNGHPFTVIGVAARRVSRDDDADAPTCGCRSPWSASCRRAAPASILTSREGVWLVMGARLKPGVSIGQAQGELDQHRAARSSRNTPTPTAARACALPPRRRFPATARRSPRFMAVLMGIVTLVLAIACANVAGVLLARASARRREIAVRLAIGAGRGRLIRQMLVESSLLFLVGGAAGLALARGR